MNKFTRILASTLLFWLGAFAFGLSQDLRRLELPVPNFSDTYFPITLGKEGFLLLSQTSRNTYNLLRFNADLERMWSVDGKMDDKLEYVTNSFDGQHVYLLFSKFESNVYQVVKVYVGPGFVENFEIYSVDKVRISEFKAFRDKIFIGGDVRNQPIILYTNLLSRQTKVLPSAMKSDAEIQSIDLDTLHQQINVSYAIRKGKSFQILVKSFDEDGRQLQQVMVEPDDDYALISGKLTTLNDSTNLMIGTYGYRAYQSANSIPVSQGLYISQVTDEEVPTNYYSFTDFKNFFNYLSPREREKKERQIQAKKEKGGDLKLNNNRLLVHDIIRQKNQYLVVAEVFYPTYRYDNSFNNQFGAFGSPWMSPFGWGWGGAGMLNPWAWGWGGRNMLFNQQRQIFDGWVYTHAVVASFDYQGKLLWDNSIEIKDLKTRTLKEKVKVSLGDDRITLFYNNKGLISRKVIKQDKVLEDTQTQAIDTQTEGDRIRRNENEDAEFWYDNFVLAWGIQRIAGEGGKRNVFYLNKISF